MLGEENILIRNENFKLKDENTIRKKLGEVSKRLAWTMTEIQKNNVQVTGWKIDTGDKKTQVKSAQKQGEKKCLVEFSNRKIKKQ